MSIPYNKWKRPKVQPEEVAEGGKLGGVGKAENGKTEDGKVAGKE